MDIVVLAVCIIVLFITLKSCIVYLKPYVDLGPGYNPDSGLEQSHAINKNMPKRKSDSNIYQKKSDKTKFYPNKKRNRQNSNASSKDGSIEIANISHKNISGSDNWNKFLGLVGLNSSDRQVVKSKPNLRQKDIEKILSRPTRVNRDKPNRPLYDISQDSSERPSSGEGFKCRKQSKMWGTDDSSVKWKKQQTDRPINRTIDLTRNKFTQKVYSPEDNTIDSETLASVSRKPKMLNGQPKLTKQIAMDCEMVGVEIGVNNDMLARVSLVNYEGDCVYDKFVKPTEPVLDYRTRVSGVRSTDLENATDFETVQREVSDIIKGRVLVGHALKNDLKVLFLTHPKFMTRDTSRFKKFREGRTPALKNLAKKYLGVDIQEGEHSSIQDALAAMQLYRMFRKEWELSIKTRKPHGSVGKSQNQPILDL